MNDAAGMSESDGKGPGVEFGPPRIGFLVERRYLRQEMPVAVMRVLAARGITSDIICPQAGCFDPNTGVFWGDDGRRLELNRYEVLISRIRTPLGLAMLRYADAAGTLAINSHASTQRVRNKAKMAIVLSRAGIACAPTMLADNVSALANLGRAWFPLILKATYGDNSQGLRLIRRPEDLPDVRWGEGLVLAQHYLPNDGFDLKLYVCGTQVFAVRKPSPFNGDALATPELVKADPAAAQLARRCGEAFGLEIYGVDTIETSTGPVVIEVNEFPNFSAIPDAAALIADHVWARMRDRSQDSVYSASSGARSFLTFAARQ
jgi:ribosomal protein S6--L-glutamate ligase